MTHYERGKGNLERLLKTVTTQVTKSVLKYKYKSSYFSSTSSTARSMKMAGTSYDSLREVGDDATFRDNRREGRGPDMRGCRCFHGYLLLAQTFSS